GTRAYLRGRNKGSPPGRTPPSAAAGVTPWRRARSGLPGGTRSRRAPDPAEPQLFVLNEGQRLRVVAWIGFGRRIFSLRVIPETLTASARCVHGSWRRKTGPCACG